MQKVKFILFVLLFSVVVLDAQSTKELKKSPKMVLVNGGSFMMGCTSEQNDCDGDESPMVEVTVKDFYIGTFEVTQDLWEEVMDKNPSKFSGGSLPVESVSWYETIEFCNKLSLMEGLEPAYKIDKSTVDPNNKNEYDKLKWTVEFDQNANGYRLPLETEWELAARGGSFRADAQTLYSGSNDIDDVAWYYENSGNETKKVGSKTPNSLGVYDMSGNVWEWCWSWKDSYSSGSISNPTGPVSGSGRVYRGGSWFSEARYCRVSPRGSDNPEYRDSGIGLRLARNK
jgi:formylglycine-generating enzyme required for sulfatase activity